MRKYSSDFEYLHTNLRVYSVKKSFEMKGFATLSPLDTLVQAYIQLKVSYVLINLMKQKVFISLPPKKRT